MLSLTGSVMPTRPGAHAFFAYADVRFPSSASQGTLVVAGAAYPREETRDVTLGPT